MKKQLIAMLLAIVMVVSLPLSASAEGWSLTVNGFLGASSEGYAVTTAPQSWTFTSTSSGTNNWDAAIVRVVTAGIEEILVRSDSFAVSEEFTWGTAGQDAFGGKQYPADWAVWQAENQAGVTCVVTAQVVDGIDADYLVIGFSNNGVTNVYKVPVNNMNDATLYLTGENCTLSNLTTSNSAAIDISAAVASIATEDNDPPAWSVVCTALGAVKSEALPITAEPQTWTFVSTSNGVNNWDAAAIDVISGAAWELTVRSDSYAVSEELPWGTAGQDSFNLKNYPADWAAWLDANKAGAVCKVTAQVVDGSEGDYIVVGFSNNGVTNVYMVPTAAMDSVSLYLTGENCVLTELAASTDHIDLSAAIASIPTEPENTDPSEEATDPSEEATDPSEEATDPSEEATDPSEEATEPSEEVTEPTIDETPADWTVDCPAWWGGHTPAVKVTETKQSWSFTNTTYATAADNWDTATVVVWRSADGTMSGAGYMEELLVRSDSYAVSEEHYWGTDGQNSVADKVYPADWAAWLDANKAGAECTVTAQIVNKQLVVAFSNNGVTNSYCVPLNTNTDNGVYLSVTGEECTISNWHATTQHLNIERAVAYAYSISTEPSDPGNADTGDHSMIGLMVLLMVSSFCGLVIVTKRRFAK